MREKKGHPLPLGVTENNGYVNFSVAVEMCIRDRNILRCTEYWNLR